MRVRISAFLVGGVLLVAACGGKSTRDPQDEGAGGSIGGSVIGGATPGASGEGAVGEAGAGAGGGVGAGGAGTGATSGAATGGFATGGRATAGASTGGAGTGGMRTGGTGGTTTGGGTDAGGAQAGGALAGGAGAGGVGGAACTQPPVPGHCSGVYYAFRHDPDLGLCVPYLFESCDMSANRYATREACLAACHGGSPDLDACASDLDCVITSEGCCGVCEPVLDTALVAVAADRLEELRELTGCTAECAPCAPPTWGEQTSQNFYPACVDGQCTVRDVRNRPIAACDTVDDCRFRCGTGCCDACGAVEDLIAVRSDADLSAEFCGGDPIPCDPCLCTVPESYRLRCDGGFCGAEFFPICEVGVDATCSEDHDSSLPAGTCDEDGTCTCYVDAGFELDPVTHLCQIPSG